MRAVDQPEPLSGVVVVIYQPAQVLLVHLTNDVVGQRLSILDRPLLATLMVGIHRVTHIGQGDNGHDTALLATSENRKSDVSLTHRSSGQIAGKRSKERFTMSKSATQNVGRPYFVRLAAEYA